MYFCVCVCVMYLCKNVAMLQHSWGDQRNPFKRQSSAPTVFWGCLTDCMLLRGILHNSWSESVCGILSPPLSLPRHFWNYSMHCQSGFDVGSRDVKSGHQVRGHLGPGSPLCHMSLWDDITSFVFFFSLLTKNWYLDLCWSFPLVLY